MNRKYALCSLSPLQHTPSNWEYHLQVQQYFFISIRFTPLKFEIALFEKTDLSKNRGRSRRAKADARLLSPFDRQGKILIYPPLGG
jgi:hypothetical protein